MSIGTIGVLSFVAGLVVATVTTPVGVSGAVFLLPVHPRQQLRCLRLDAA